MNLTGFGQNVIPLDHSIFGTRVAERSLIRLDVESIEKMKAVPLPGEGNWDVFSTLPGMSKDRIRPLQEEG